MINTWKQKEVRLYVAVITIQIYLGAATLWSEWWTYHGISGSDMWGKANKEWAICHKGKYQSPINIDPTTLVHDPNLTKLNISLNKVNGLLTNTGQDLKVIINDTHINPFVFTGGPLSYEYTLYEIKLHFGDSNRQGSEHSVGGKKFPLEMQLYGYNAEIHKNNTQAVFSPNGIAVIVILALINEEDNINFDSILRFVDRTYFKGSSVQVNGLSINSLLPPLDNFVTYEGSLTQPGCMETVTWVILNKPLHISSSQMNTLRQITKSRGPQRPLMVNNYRDLTPVHGRLLRTNIKSKLKDEDCYTIKLTSYEVNEKFKQKT